MYLQSLSIVILANCAIAAKVTTRQRVDTPICVQKGTCILDNVSGGVDIRRMDPDETGSCPVGRQLCHHYTNATKCGYIYNSAMSTQDGRAPYGSHPWLAYIVNQTGFTGSGVLLDQYHVLTAAHKVYPNKNSLQRLEIYLGVHDTDTMATAYKRMVDEMIIHPSFNPITLHNDLAVLRLKAHIPLGYQKNVATACLPKSNERFAGKRCMVAGWGVTKFGTPDAPTHFLKQVTVPIVPYEQCWKAMSTFLGDQANFYLDKDGEICAGGEVGKDACTDDGGAPLICRDSTGRKVVAGLVMWGKKCGEPNVFGVYADVPKYVDWIQTAIRNLRA